MLTGESARSCVHLALEAFEDVVVAARVVEQQPGADEQRGSA